MLSAAQEPHKGPAIRMLFQKTRKKRTKKSKSLEWGRFTFHMIYRKKLFESEEGSGLVPV
ncbi:MAG TPA: hypothetical protein DD433_08830 [Ruminococcaceae bacterium]|nr:hypothetical protein [Oscillospiraceae bacterium]